ncbi:MAG: sodium:solute symporter [Bacteroidetes bacterium]|nr:sodium:solute symporter [Bacteroidota bacterium]
MISPIAIITSIAIYFCFLLLIAWYTSRNATNESYFTGNKTSPWYAVAFGMIGDSLSGVTFISLPGTVGTAKFSYLQLVLGYLLGYYIIAKVLLPLYYKLNLTSIYSYLQQRFGANAQKTGSFFFLLSRIIGAALRLYLAVSVIQLFVFDSWDIPFFVSVALIIALMLIYTYKGGIKTLVWTDTFQSALLLVGVVLSIVALVKGLNWSAKETVVNVVNSDYSQIFFWDWKEKNFFFKQFFSGAFIAIVMTGLDQNMMQKNLSCKSLPEAQKNILSFSFVLVIVNIFFVALGALLYLYTSSKGIEIPLNSVTGKPMTDKLFPLLALNHLGIFAAIVFILGLTAATFSSADSVLTTLTTSFAIDFLKLDTRTDYTEEKKKNIRHLIHLAFGAILLLTIVGCSLINQTSVLDAIFTVAAYTYGPLLGLFAFGLFTTRISNDKYIPVLCFIPPLICYVLYENSAVWFNGYKFGYELLLLNGLLTYYGLWLNSKKATNLVTGTT